MINEIKLNKSEYHELRFVEEDASPGEAEITMHLTTGSETEPNIDLVDPIHHIYTHVGINVEDARRLIKWLEKITSQY